MSISIVVHLTRGYHAVIDTQDEDLTRFKWSAKVTNDGGIYATRSTRVNGRRVDVLMHRLILSRKLGIELARQQLTDHRDRDSLNNRRDNLRLATSAQNNRNTSIGKNNKSGIIGVSWSAKSRKWTAYICVNYKTRYLGLFDDIADAVNARRVAEETDFGEFSPERAPNEHGLIASDKARPRDHKHRYADMRMRSDNRSGFKGVWATGYKNPNKRFATACARQYLGSFPTAEEAYSVYCEAHAKHYGREPQHADS